MINSQTTIFLHLIQDKMSKITISTFIIELFFFNCHVLVFYLYQDMNTVFFF